MNSSENQPTLDSCDFQLTIDSMALYWYRWAKVLNDSVLFAEDDHLLAPTSESSQRAWKGYSAVAAAKGTLEASMRNVALEFAKNGLRCNVLQPGINGAIIPVDGGERISG